MSSPAVAPGEPKGEVMRSLAFSSLCISFLNRSSPDLQAAGSYMDFKVQIATTGEYQLYLRDSGFDGSSDSVYARVVELQTSAGGPGPDWYRYAPDPDSGDFSLILNNPDDANSTAGWEGYGTPEVNDGGNGGDRVKVVWKVTKAGISHRADSTARRRERY